MVEGAKRKVAINDQQQHVFKGSGMIFRKEDPQNHDDDRDYNHGQELAQKPAKKLEDLVQALTHILLADSEKYPKRLRQLT